METLKIYFEVCSFICFCRELEENKMMAIQTISLSEDKSVKTLYNKDLYKYDETVDVLKPNNASEKLFPSFGTRCIYVYLIDGIEKRRVKDYL